MAGSLPMALFSTDRATTRTRVHHAVSHVITHWLALRYEVAISSCDLAEFLISLCPPPPRKQEVEVHEFVTAWNAVKPSLPMLLGPVLLDITLTQKSMEHGDIADFFQRAGRGPSLILEVDDEKRGEKASVTAVDLIDREILIYDSCKMSYRRIDRDSSSRAIVVLPKITKVYLKRGNRPSKGLAPPSEVGREVERWPDLSAGLCQGSEATPESSSLAIVPVPPTVGKKRKREDLFADDGPGVDGQLARAEPRAKVPRPKGLGPGFGECCVGCGFNFNGEPKSVSARLPEKKDWMIYATSDSDEKGYPVCQRCYRTKVNVFPCVGCGEEKSIVSRVQERADWMLETASRDSGGFPVCNVCYRKHVNSSHCSGCGEWRNVVARILEQEPWMASSSSKNHRGDYAVCHSCYKKFMGHALCSGCNREKLVATRVPTRESWMQGTLSSHNGGFAVCVTCYKKHLPCAVCSGCGQEKAAVALVPRKERWMQPSTLRTKEGFVVCHVCYCRYVYRAACAGCGDEKALALSVHKHHEWMRPDVKRTPSGYPLCTECAKANLDYWLPGAVGAE
uniref:Uncharacterized protein n=1 Tax=Alexandrium catenella TaxID=2925 RepID=A0A7S1KWM0_ALECA